MKLSKALLLLPCLLIAHGTMAQSPAPERMDLHAFVQERVKSVVAFEFYMESEIDRRDGDGYALIIDEDGTCVVLESLIPAWAPPERLKGFKGFTLPDNGEEYEMEYLGQDYLSNWHVLRFKDGLPEGLHPITNYDFADVKMGDRVIGVGSLEKDLGFDPFVLTGEVAIVKGMPDDRVILRDEICNPGCPVFNEAGDFVGWGMDSMPRNEILSVRRENMRVTLRNPEETSVFLAASDFKFYLDHLSEDPAQAERPWIGVAGMQPIDPEVAKYLGLDGGGIVLSEIIDDRPAAQGGLENNDIVVSVNGESLPDMKPDYALIGYFQNMIRVIQPGDSFELGVIRGSEPFSVTVNVGVGPKIVREADFEYFERLGFTVREFLLSDAIQRRLSKDEAQGSIVNFVKPNTPVNTAGLRFGDWIKQVDGQDVNSYEEAVAALKGIAEDESRSEFVLLVERDNETAVIRTQLQ